MSIKQFMNFIKNSKYIVALKIFVLLIIIYLFLMNADLSEAPEFIYNQF